MPGYQGHLCGGVFTFVMLAAAILAVITPTPLMFLECAIFCLAGSLFPDIDIKSKGQKYFYWLILILVIMLTIQARWKLLSVVSVLMITPMLVKHRGVFHQLWFVIAIPSAIAYCSIVLAPANSKIIILNTIFFVAGAISHLWLDMGFKRMIRGYVYYR